MKRFTFRRISAAALACTMGFLGCVSGRTEMQAGAAVDEETARRMADAVVSVVNNERAKLGLPEYSALPDLMNAANIRAEELSVKFGHIRPDGSAPSSALTGSYGGFSEINAGGSGSAYDVVAGWMQSDLHRPHILSEEHTHVGVGYYLNDAGVPYWNMNFVGSYADGEVAYHAGQYIPARVCGDADGSQVINTKDASMILAYSAAVSADLKYPVVRSFKKAADVNGDGSIDSIDASILLCYNAAKGSGQQVTLEDFIW